MKNTVRGLVSAAVLLASMPHVFAAKVEKTLGTFFEQTQATRFGADGDYGFQTYIKGAGIDASGSEKANIVLEMEYYIENLDNPGHLAIIDNATFNQIEVGNTLDNGATILNWPIKGLLDADGNPVKSGVWNKLRLKFSESRGGSGMDLTSPLGYFRWCVAHIHEPEVPDDYQIRLRNVRLVDSSQLVDEDDGPVYDNTDYLAAEIPYTLDGTLTGTVSGGFSVGKVLDNPIDVSHHDPKMLYLQFDAEIEEGTPGDINVLKTAPGQIELTSGGRPDTNELCFNISSPDWKTGKHTYSLAFTTASTTGGAIDYAAINYMRIYVVRIPETLNRLSMKVSNVKIIDRTNSTSLPTLFGSGMMFQQRKPMNIWGYTGAGREIGVKLYRTGELISSVSSTAGSDGRWSVSLPAQDASFDKYAIEVIEDGEVIQTIDDILVGEVWVAGGQSNMALTVGSTQQSAELMAGADNDNIRFLYMPTYPYSGNGNGEMPIEPTRDIAGAYWGHGNNGTQVGSVSAVAYLAVKELQERLGIPVGFLYTAVGGSVIEAWLPREELDANATLVNELNRRGLYFDKDFWVNASTTVTALYNQKVGPLAGFNVAGVLWYQGESNSQRPELYADELLTMKRGWERTFNFPTGTMPFVYCQVGRWVVELNNPHYLAGLDEAMCDAWAADESTRSTMSLLPIYDTDMSYDGNVVIHPTNKTPVARRFATAMYNLVYDMEGSEYTAPVLDDVTVGDGYLTVRFSHVGDGLCTLDGLDDVHGFAVCDDRGVYVNAQTRIISADEVKVWSDALRHPADVTYAYATYNFTANLANSVGIAAAPFRSVRTAGQAYYNPQDWTYADGEKYWGIISSDAAGWVGSWQAENASVSFDTDVKQEGAASLKLDYSTDGEIAFGPVTSHLSVVNQLGNFNNLSVWVCNPDGREKTLSLSVTLADGTVVDCGAKPVSADSEWQKVIFSLKGESAESVMSRAVTGDVRFMLSDSAAGKLYVDNVSFGLDEDLTSGLADAVADNDWVQDADPYYYNVLGQRFFSPVSPGIYIHKGRRILVK